ncbi:PAS domain S-box protein [Halorhabdus sp. CBA1104]|uniref:hybrid sensor histidine kinase/response regulator n=1 Tax=unclassified Halorhabdus TaxID=2621901 RepID=UPI0012B2AB7C|nr:MULTISPECIES: PAS domain S-box protein [unclassified Halorhabdus]QGN07046.1 PAS domain S-box protein [Halorhabdus sp. CBA1104]
MEETIRVLYVGSESDAAASVATTLECEDDRLAVESVVGASAALTSLDDSGFECVVSAFDLPDATGIELLETVRERHLELPFVLFTAMESPVVASDAVSAGVTELLFREARPAPFSRLAKRIVDIVSGDRDRRDSRSGKQSSPAPEAMSQSSAQLATRLRELERVEARFEALTQQTTLGVLTIDEDSVIQYANDAVTGLFGYEPAELIGEPLYTIMPERFHDDHMAAVARYLEAGQRQLDWDWIELPGRHRDGTEIPLGISFGETTIDGEHRFTGIIRDISTRKRQQRKRQDTLDTLQRLYAVTADPDDSFEDKIERLLELGCEHFELPYGFLSRIETGPDGDLSTGTQRIVHAHGDHELLQPGETCPLSEAYCRKTIQADDLLVIADAVAAGWDDDPAYEVFDLGSYVGGKVVANGELYGTLCFASTEPRDEAFSDAEQTIVRLMSKWVSYELEQGLVTTELERQNERLDEFASVLAHDLRNPLNVAVGRVDVLQSETDSDHLEDVADALDRMDALIDDVLTLAQGGQSVTDTTAVDLSTIAEASWETVATEHASLHVDSTVTIQADRSRLQQLFENLFRNAVEHTGQAVTVTVGALENGFFVADDGPGIPVDERQTVFESGYTTAEDGTGFGLAIVREIVQAHDWTISVTESDDGGARFEIMTGG